ncbi:MAG: hypothetical protein QOI73_1958 [Solirubrobacteraceae bacterium]|nr:hypothetical protein [Solirubrobacteraceae bacterium]
MRAPAPLACDLAALGAGLLLATGCGDATQASAPARDCGTVVVRAPRVSMRCFDAAFERCAPATVLVDNRAPVLSGVKVRYAIRGRSGSACRMTWSYVALPSNPSWEHKDVTCSYPAGRRFQAALDSRRSMDGCTGPLMKVIGG